MSLVGSRVPVEVRVTGFLVRLLLIFVFVSVIVFVFVLASVFVLVFVSVFLFVFVCNCLCICLCIWYQGESYFWCYTASSWDYCSPEPEIIEETKTRSGFTCNGICDKMSSTYLFCETKMATGWKRSWWDYCSTN